MAVGNRKLRGGMVGGGAGSFIGPVHRMAALLDGEAEWTAGAFSAHQAGGPAANARAAAVIHTLRIAPSPFSD